jgi:hypothetical protein
MPKFNNDPKTYNQYFKSKMMMEQNPELAFVEGFTPKKDK